MAHLPSTLSQSHDLLASHLDAHVEHIATAAAAVDTSAGDLTRLGTQLLAGGKRLRPLLCYWSWRAQRDDDSVSDDEHKAICDLSIALELFQASALVHDDLIDRSETRRGAPTAHVSLSKAHADLGWLGEGEGFGSGGAILLGDLLLMEANALVSRALEDAPADVRIATRQLFDDMQRAVTIGQYLDLRNQTTPWPSDLSIAEAAAWKVIETKTATYSTVHPLLLGASLAGASGEILETLRRIGQPLGEAFQLRDDLLGVLGDPLTMGKPAGDDLREGKRTVLIVRALQALPAADRRELHEIVGNPSMTPAQLSSALDLIMRSGAAESIEALIAERSSSALELLDQQEWQDPGLAHVRTLAHQLVDRHK